MNGQTSKAYKLIVHFTNAGALSHLLHCYCKTAGKPAAIEKAYTVKKVNFYRFKEYVTTVMNVTDFNSWYLENKGRVAFNDALTCFINASENRTRIFSTETLIDRTLNQLLNSVRYNNQLLRNSLTA